jgi:choline dehydrogenase-like flavoprotein
VPEDPVDVLIIGAGAAGAALAWSLAETRMNILCLEQGDWMDPATYPSNGSDWEMRRFGDFGLSPNSRGRPEDYPVNDAESPAARSSTPRTSPASVLRTSGSARSTASPTTGRSTTRSSHPITISMRA